MHLHLQFTILGGLLMTIALSKDLGQVLQKYIPNRIDIQIATMTDKDPRFFTEKKNPNHCRTWWSVRGMTKQQEIKSHQSGHCHMSTDSKCSREPGDGWTPLHGWWEWTLPAALRKDSLHMPKEKKPFGQAKPSIVIPPVVIRCWTACPVAIFSLKDLRKVNCHTWLLESVVFGIYFCNTHPGPFWGQLSLAASILQARLRQYMNRELPDVQARFRKGRGTRDQIANICWIVEKKSSRKTSPLPGASTRVPTHDKGHAERPDMQRRVRTWGCPSGPAWESTPKPESVCFTASWLSPTPLTLTGGYPRPPFLWRKST